MKIQKVTSTLYNNFYAIMECEHCGGIQELKTGYDDGYYHSRVIPAITCKSCKKNREGVVPDQPNDNGYTSV